MSELYLPAGAAAAGPYDLEITPTSAGWGYSSLKVITLDAGAEHEFSCAGEEIIVVPLSGGASVTTGGETFALVGRTDVFAGPTDIFYLPSGAEATLQSTDGGERAWKISDHPDQTWVRGTWADQPVDPRLTTTSGKDS